MVIENDLRIWLAGFALISLTTSMVQAQTVIYARSPVTAAGQSIVDGQPVDEGITLDSGPGGLVIVELDRWPSIGGKRCSLFVIASGGKSQIVPRRRGAQVKECGAKEHQSTIDRAFNSEPIGTSVLLATAGAADGERVTTSEAIYGRLRALTRRTPSAGGVRAGLNETVADTTTAPAAASVALTITIESATYGANCGAPAGNMTSILADACNGKRQCEYIIDYQVIGDPAPGCAKSYQASFRCGPQTPLQMETIGGEAGFKSALRIACQ